MPNLKRKEEGSSGDKKACWK